MSEWKAAAHVRYNLWYHLVWSPKYRKGLLAQTQRKRFLYQLIREIAERYEFDVERVAIDTDYVHIFLQAPPRYSPAQIVKAIKGVTAREMFLRFPEIKRLLWGGELWEDGYCVRSVGNKVSEEVIQRYIAEHHKKTGHEPQQLEFFR